MITQDPFIISVVAHGFQISILDNFPGFLRKVTIAPRNLKAHLSMCSEIQDLIQKNVIVEIENFPMLCLSPIFVIPKKSGELRVILNLKKINLFIAVQHFRMETLKVILLELCSRDWAVSIDLKDAYLHVPIHPQSRRFLGFRYHDKTYTYKVIPFGLKDSPWVFSRIFATVIGHLRRQGIRIFYYLDDWLLVAESQALLESHLQITLELSQRLGFIINWKKSMLIPQRMSTYLGAPLDIPRLIVRSVERRVVALQALIQDSALGSSSSPVAEVPRSSGQLCRSGPELQASHETSTATPSSVLYPSFGPSVEADSFDTEDQEFVCSMGVSGSSAGREPLLSSPSRPGADFRRLPLRLGSGPSASSGVRCLV